MTEVQNIGINTLGGAPTSLDEYAGRAILVVNVASKCGLTPQYEKLEKLANEYSAQGLSVIGVPCNQFGGQEPGSADEIETFCSTTYGITFPMTEKVDVNGDNQHPLYAELTKIEDAEGNAGDVQWNFEKFLISPDGVVTDRFRPRTEPDAPEVLAAIDKILPKETMAV